MKKQVLYVMIGLVLLGLAVPAIAADETGAGGPVMRDVWKFIAAAFVLGIAALFTPMGVISALSGKLMGSALSNAFVVVGLAILFTALAASMFGAFELALPSGLNNKLSTVGGVGLALGWLDGADRQRLGFHPLLVD